jgi:arylsulfatase
MGQCRRKPAYRGHGPSDHKTHGNVDDEFFAAAVDFIDRAKQTEKPFFVWFNTTRMHNFTHVRAEHRTSGLGEYADGMIEHDAQIGKMLDYLDQAGLAANTIVIYTTDNGPMVCLWPDAASTPFRGEKNTNWEGGWRVPAFVRWPGKIKAGSVVNGIVTHQDWLPTFMAAAGEPDIKEKLLNGRRVGGKIYKVHLDGFNMLPYLTGEIKESPREFFFYISDDGDILAIRMRDWKVVLKEQRAKTLQCWLEPFVPLRAPKIFHLRRDPFERADENSNSYYDLIFHAYIIYAMQGLVAQQIENFRKFPPRQKPASFNLDGVLRTLEEASGGANH